MTKLKFFSSVGVALAALIPFTSLIPSSMKGAKPSLLSKDKFKAKELGGVDEIFSNQTLRVDRPQESFSEITQSPRSDSKQAKEKEQFEKNKSINEKQDQQNKELSKEVIQVMKKEANLSEWLDTINPLIKQKQNLTIITRWNKKYFRLIQWDQDCQCFVLSDLEYGIWSNSAGLFVIGSRWENPQKNAVSPTTNSKCTNFNSFWYQDWNTWWRLNSWLKSFENDKDSHIAVASCHKNPVVFLGTNTYFPAFLKSRGSRNITTDGPMNYFYDHQNNRFETLRGSKKVLQNLFKVSSYPDWKRLWNINGSGRNFWRY